MAIPVGSVSLKFRLLSGTVDPELSMLKTSAVLPPDIIGLIWKIFEKPGCGLTFRAACAVFFVNNGGWLENHSDESGADYLGNSRSATFFDLEGDGDLDMALNNFHGPVRIFENRLESREKHWLKLRLEDDPTRGISRDAIGAIVIVSSAHHRKMWHQVSSTTGYLSVHPKTLHFGLGEDTEADIEVHWPGGKISRWNSVQADRLIHLSLSDAETKEQAPDSAAIEIPLLRSE